LLQNPLILRDGYGSGSNLLATSLPIKVIYEFANKLNLRAITAMQFHIILEILFQNYLIYFAAKSLTRYRWTKISSTLAFFNIFQIVAPINLANWSFMYGGNYGFSYSLAILSIVFTIQKRFGHLVFTSTVLLATHFTVGIIV
jgi:hypothetical protein